MNRDRVKLIVDSIQYDLSFIQGREDLGYPISKLEYFSPKPHNSNIIARVFLLPLLLVTESGFHSCLLAEL